MPMFDNKSALSQWLRERSLGSHELRPLGDKLQHKFTHFDLSIDPYFLKLHPAASHFEDQFRWYHPAAPLEIGLPKPIQTLIKRSEPYL